MRKIEATFYITVEDNFEDAVRRDLDISEDDPIDNQDIREFLELSMTKPVSCDSAFEIEGGDTGGWFVQSINIK